MAERNRALIVVNGEAASDGTIICDGGPVTLDIYNPPPEGYVGDWPPPSGALMTFRTDDTNE